MNVECSRSVSTTSAELRKKSVKSTGFLDVMETQLDRAGFKLVFLMLVYDPIKMVSVTFAQLFLQMHICCRSPKFQENSCLGILGLYVATTLV